RLLRVCPELAARREALRRARLVQLAEVDLVAAEPGPLEQLPDGRNRPDAHHAGVNAGHRAADEPAERLDAELLRLLLARDHERGGAVVDSARVARSDGALGAKGRPQRCQLL